MAMEKDMFARFTARETGLLTGGKIAPSVPNFKLNLGSKGQTTELPKPFLSAREVSDRKHDRMLFLLNDWPFLKHTWEYYEEYDSYERYVPNLMSAFKPAVDAWHKCMREKAAEKTRRQNLTK